MDVNGQSSWHELTFGGADIVSAVQPMGVIHQKVRRQISAKSGANMKRKDNPGPSGGGLSGG